MADYSLDIKRTFLSFAQALFAEDPKYTWNVDPIVTKILILDKYAIDLEVLEKTRSIVLSRGSYGWTYASLGQSSNHGGATVADQTLRGRQYTDLVRGSITFNCIAKNGIVAEHLAHKLFANLTGAKEQFRANGIHALRNINIGEESILKSDSNIELVAVPVYVQFETQKNLQSGIDTFTFQLLDSDGLYHYQGADYLIDNLGIHFYEAPVSTQSFTAIYTHAITMAEVNEPLIGDVDGVNKDFEVTYPIYAAYPLWSGTELTVSGISW